MHNVIRCPLSRPPPRRYSYWAPCGSRFYVARSPTCPPEKRETAQSTVNNIAVGGLGDLDAKRKSRWIDRIVGGAGGAAVAILVGVAVYNSSSFKGELTRVEIGQMTMRSDGNGCNMLRDDLDENGGGDLDFEAAAGSGVMIVADLQLCKFFRRRC